MEEKLQKVYMDSKKYSNTIMPEIMSILSKRKIKFHANSSNTEICVTTNKPKAEIQEIIKKKLSQTMSNDVMDMLLNFVAFDKNIYIRLSRQ